MMSMMLGWPMAAGGACLVHEPGHQHLVLRQLGMQQLDRGLAPGEGVARKVHGAHSTFADDRDDFVVVEAQTDHDGLSHAGADLTAFPRTGQDDPRCPGVRG